MSNTEVATDTYETGYSDGAVEMKIRVLDQIHALKDITGHDRRTLNYAAAVIKRLPLPEPKGKKR